MKKTGAIRAVEISINIVLAISVIFGIYLFVTSFSHGLSESDRAARASLGGIVPMVAIMIQRLFSFIIRDK